MYKREKLTITKDAVKLVLRQEGKPVDSLLLVFAQLRFDLYRKYILFDFVAIQKLRQELTFVVSPSEEFFRETRRVW